MAGTKASQMHRLEAIIKDHTEQMAEVKAQQSTMQSAFKLRNDQQMEELKDLKNLIKGNDPQQNEERSRVTPTPFVEAEKQVNPHPYSNSF